MKCELCKKKILETFLNKPLGTYVKDSKGKKHSVCHNCQKQFKSKEQILDKLTR